MKVFLGGTCGDSKWRDDLVEGLKMDYFNPVVADWNEEAKQNEIREREQDDFVLYVITPKIVGVYSIAEVSVDSVVRPEKTIFCVLDKDGESTYTKQMKYSLEATKKLVEQYSHHPVFDNLDSLRDYLNECVDDKPKHLPQESEESTMVKCSGDEPKYVSIVKIVVPSQFDKEQLLLGIKYIHDSDVDMDYSAVNTLAHIYQIPDIIQVEGEI